MEFYDSFFLFQGDGAKKTSDCNSKMKDKKEKRA